MAATLDSTKNDKPASNFRQANRLNLIHWILKGMTGYLLHPKVQYPDRAIIADIGSGTATWVQEVAQQLPNASVFGFDISPDLYPHSSWRMPNVNLTIRDCFKPFPDELIGTFDVVHICYFRCIIEYNGAEPLLRNLATLLKPGGYLQWFDALGNQARVQTPGPTVSTKGAEHLAKVSALPGPQLPADWIDELPQLLSKNGFDVVAADRVDFMAPYRQAWAQSNLGSLQDQSATGRGDAFREAQGMIEQLEGEVAQGVCMELPMTCVVGQKRG